MNYGPTRLRQLTTITLVLGALALAPQLAAETSIVIPPGRVASPQDIIVGPDHNLWFTEFGGLKIGRITPAGALTEFSISGAQALCGIASGPDGNIWFTDEYTGTIGHINTSGTGLITYAVPGGAHPQAIVTGPDGKLWFVDQQVNPQLPSSGFRVGSITVAGQITEHLTRVNPGLFSPDAFAPAQIAVGPDGNLWFTNPQASSVGNNVLGKVTTAGAITIYNLADSPNAITSGPDGNLWVTESGNVAKVTTSGVETPYPISFGGSGGITTGPDGNLWFTETNTVGFITPAGALTEFPPANYSASFLYMTGMVAGPDGALWMLGSFPSNVGRVATSGQLTNNYPLNLGSNVSEVTLGPDGAVWTTQWIDDKISRVDTQGHITSFPLPAGGRALFITTGPDGNLWFTEPGRNSVAKMTTSGTVTEYSVGQRSAGLWSIIKGPDGNLWFTEYSPRYNNIVRITTSGVMTPFTIPTPSARPFYITNGPDGNLWFTEFTGPNVGKVNPANGQITEYPFNGSGNSLAAIASGPDGNLWIMEGTAHGAVGKFSTSGTVLGEYPVQFETFLDIKAGPDGALWMPQFYPNSIARITTSGVVSTVPMTSPNAVTNGLAIGSDNKIYVTEGESGALGRLSAIGGTGDSFHATHGSPFNGAVASFVDGTATATHADFTATINWGDGTQSAGTVSGPTGGPFTVTGTHTYPFAWNFLVTVTLHDSVDNSTYTASPGSAGVN